MAKRGELNVCQEMNIEMKPGRFHHGCLFQEEAAFVLRMEGQEQRSVITYPLGLRAQHKLHSAPHCPRDFPLSPLFPQQKSGFSVNSLRATALAIFLEPSK